MISHIDRGVLRHLCDRSLHLLGIMPVTFSGNSLTVWILRADHSISHLVHNLISECQWCLVLPEIRLLQISQWGAWNFSVNNPRYTILRVYLPNES